MPIIEWEKRENLDKSFSFEYWNNQESEKKKPWFVDDVGKIDKLKNFLVSSRLANEFEQSLAILRERGFLRGRVLDLAAGVCWTSAWLSQQAEIDHIDALEFSWLRLNYIAPHVVAGLQGKSDKIRFVYGSFYNLKPEKNYDLIYMSQAFHHAHEPERLLNECKKYLAKNGCIFLTGEHYFSKKLILRRFLSVLIKQGKIQTSFQKLFPPSLESGDHYYRKRDYKALFEKAGFKIEFFESQAPQCLIALATLNS